MPAKKLTPIMAKMRINNEQTIVTLVMDGKEERRALTMSFIP